MLESSQSVSSVIRFGAFEADFQTHELRNHGVRLRLPGQSFQILKMLLERPGRLVTREELQKALWPSDTFVDFDHSLNAAVNRLREALSDSADEPRLVETLPRRGYRFIAPLENSPDAHLPVHLGSETQVARRTGTLRLTLLLVACALLAGVGLFVYKRHLPPSTTQRALARLTFDDGLQIGATWSPDGRFVAYSSDRGGKFDVWVQQISGGDPVQITKSPGHNWQPDWSPDGKYIAYRSEDGKGGLFIIPALGGAGLERRITTFGYYPRWSPDSSQLLFQTNAGPFLNKFDVVSVDGSQPREVLTRFSSRPLPIKSAAWHPDGKRITIWALGSDPVPTFWTLSLAGGEAVRSVIDPQILKQLGEVSASLSDEVNRDLRFSWMPSGKAIIFEYTFRGVRNLWKLSVDPETLKAYAIERLTTGSGLDTELAISSDGKRVAFTVESDRVRAWVFPFNSTTGRLTGAGRAATSAGMEAWRHTLSRDGKKLAFQTLRAGKWELWEASLAQQREVPIAPGDSYRRYNPQWSPDGMHLAYGRDQVGKVGFQLFIWSAERRDEEVLTPLSKLDLGVSDWSPDGKQLLVAQETSDGLSQISTLSSIPLPNSETRLRKIAAMENHYLWQPRFSPDGRWIAFVAQGANLATIESTIYVISANGGPWIRVTDGKLWDDKPKWAPDGKMLYFLSRQAGFYNVWGIHLDTTAGRVTGDRFRVTTFDSPNLMVPNDMGGVELSLNQDKLVLNLSQVSGSIWVLNDVDQ